MDCQTGLKNQGLNGQMDHQVLALKYLIQKSKLSNMIMRNQGYVNHKPTHLLVVSSNYQE